MLFIQNLHSPWYYIITFGFLAFFCYLKAWHGFKFEKELKSKFVLSQSFMLIAIFCFGFAVSFYSYQSKFFPTIKRDDFLKFGLIWHATVLFTAGLHGLLNRKIIGLKWHFWFSLQMLIYSLFGLIGFIVSCTW